MSNKELIAGCLNFNPESRKVLYDKYASQMYSVCLRYANSKEDANDIFQQGFYTIYKNLKQVKNPDALSGWVKRVFVNTALEIIKKNAKYSSAENLSLIHISEPTRPY